MRANNFRKQIRDNQRSSLRHDKISDRGAGMSSLCGAGAPAREKPAAKIVSSHSGAALTRAALKALARSFAVLAQILKEIFDESAYQRFLDRKELQSSAQAYAMFRRENEQAKSR